MRTLLSVYITSRGSSSSSKPYLGLWTPDSVCLSPTLLVPIHYPNCLSQRVCNYLLPYLLDIPYLRRYSTRLHINTLSHLSFHPLIPHFLAGCTHFSLKYALDPPPPPRLFQALVRILSDIELNPPSDRF